MGIYYNDGSFIPLWLGALESCDSAEWDFAGTDPLLLVATQDDPGFMAELRIFIRKEVLKIFEGMTSFHLY